MIITPRLSDGRRIKIKVKKDIVPRGSRWQKTFTELRSGNRVVLRGASCGIPSCYCDAVVVKRVV